ncbi:MAG: N-acetylmuramoyl-L-alanine amidase [Nitrospirota bacterium]|nr:N-acetylmuramoyl-L-alanine amidase [Nitrospirota bacterium]
MKFHSRSIQLVILHTIFLAFACAPAIASVEPATLKALPDEVQAGRQATFKLTTKKIDGIREVEVSYRGPGIWFAESLELKKTKTKKQKIYWEATTPERLDHPGEIIYFLRLVKDDGTETITDELSTVITSADIPPRISDPHPSPLFPVAGNSFKMISHIEDDKGVKRVSLFYRMGQNDKFREVPMRRRSGNKKDGKWVYLFKKVGNAGSMTCYVKAWDTAKQSARSNDLSFAVRTPASLPAVQGLSAKAESDGIVRLSWEPVKERVAEEYHLFRDGRFLGSTTSSEFTDRDLPPAANLIYQVAATKNDDIVGPRSEAVKVEIPVTANRPPRVWVSEMWRATPVYPGATISGGAEDTDASDAVKSLRITLDNGLSRTIQGKDLREWSFHIPSDTRLSGRHTLVVEAFDRHGAVRRSESSLLFVLEDPRPLRNKTITIDAGHGLFWTGKEWSYQRPHCYETDGEVTCNRELSVTGDGLVEDEITIFLAEKVVRHLKNLGARVLTTRDLERQNKIGASGYPVWREGALCYLTGIPESAPKWRSDDVHVRWQYAEFMQSDIMVSIHANLGKMSGTETIYSYDDRKDGKDRQLANDIQQAVISELRKRDPLWVDRRAKTDLEASAHFDAVVKRPLLPSVIVEAGFNDNIRDHQNLKDPAFQESFAKGVATGILRYFERQQTRSSSSADYSK